MSAVEVLYSHETNTRTREQLWGGEGREEFQDQIQGLGDLPYLAPDFMCAIYSS
jgi:hypothetical protein